MTTKEGFIKVEEIYHGITVVKNSEGLYNFIDPSQKLLSSTWFKSFGVIQNKVIPVEMEDGTWYRLAINGKLFKEGKTLTKKDLIDNSPTHKEKCNCKKHKKEDGNKDQ
jgi:hypothetical protein